MKNIENFIIALVNPKLPLFWMLSAGTTSMYTVDWQIDTQSEALFNNHTIFYRHRKCKIKSFFLYFGNFSEDPFLN